MAWTLAREKRAICLHGSMWSAGAIAIAVGVTRRAVLGKFFRLRKAEHVDMLMADLARHLSMRAGVRVFDAAALNAMQQEHGFRAGLEKALASAGASLEEERKDNEHSNSECAEYGSGRAGDGRKRRGRAGGAA